MLFCNLLSTDKIGHNKIVQLQLPIVKKLQKMKSSKQKSSSQQPSTKETRTDVLPNPPVAFVPPTLTPQQIAIFNSFAMQNPDIISQMTGVAQAAPLIPSPLNSTIIPSAEFPLLPLALTKSIPPVVQQPPRLPETPPKAVPAFLNKLYNMVSDPTSNSLIHWSDDGRSFFVDNIEDFAKDLLPQFFKHSNFSSFVRQLNMYGFHKVPHLSHGSLTNEEDVWEFSSPYFIRGQPELMQFMNRKKSRTDEDRSDSLSVDLPHIISELSAIKKHQQTISNDLANFQQENQLLWHETLVMRDRYQKQQDTINKIMRFLASVFSKNTPTVYGNKKRPYLLPDHDDDEPNRQGKFILLYIYSK